jgi:hypothetical protein
MSGELEITMKNTKAEMMDALKSALERAEASEKGRLNPERIEKEKTEKRAVESAKESVGQNIFSMELNNKFKDLQLAISSEQSRLQELYGVSAQLQKLALIIETGREQQAQIERENSEKLETAKTALESLMAEYAEKKAELQEEYDNMAKKLKMERTREAEEYQYNNRREREKENNSWEDEKTARELALSKKEAQARAILTEAEAKAQHIASLESKVEGIPALIEAEKKSAIDLAVSEIIKEYEHKTALADKDFQNALARQNDKIAYLEKELAVSNKSNVALQDKLDKAYTELRELATKTVESASGVKIISGTGDRTKE